MHEGEALKSWIERQKFATVSDFVRDRTGEEPEEPQAKSLRNLISRLFQKETFSRLNWETLTSRLPDLSPEALAEATPEEAPSLKEVLSLIEQHKEEAKKETETLLQAIKELKETIESLRNAQKTHS